MENKTRGIDLKGPGAVGNQKMLIVRSYRSKYNEPTKTKIRTKIRTGNLPPRSARVEPRKASCSAVLALGLGEQRLSYWHHEAWEWESYWALGPMVLKAIDACPPKLIHP